MTIMITGIVVWLCDQAHQFDLEKLGELGNTLKKITSLNCKDLCCYHIKIKTYQGYTKVIHCVGIIMAELFMNLMEN